MDVDSLGMLRRRIALIERREGAGPEGAVRRPTGHPAIDRRLEGGLSPGALHEVIAAEAEEGGSAAGFTGMLTLLLGGEVLWLRDEASHRRIGGLHAMGLVEIGLDPARIILGMVGDAAATLRAAADAMRCTGLGVVVIELWGRPPVLDLTASRRLALAAEGSGVSALLLRMAADPGPSSAQTRWQVAAAPSAPLPANAPGHPGWTVELLRQRGGPPGGPWQVEWNRDRAQLQDRGADRRQALSGAVVPLPADRSPDPAGHGPLRRAG